jgi:hypothetical protein
MRLTPVGLCDPWPPKCPHPRRPAPPAMALGDRLQFAALIDGRLLGCRNAQIDGDPFGDPLALAFGHLAPRLRPQCSRSRNFEGFSEHSFRSGPRELSGLAHPVPAAGALGAEGFRITTGVRVRPWRLGGPRLKNAIISRGWDSVRPLAGRSRQLSPWVSGRGWIGPRRGGASAATTSRRRLGRNGLERSVRMVSAPEHRKVHGRAS